MKSVPRTERLIVRLSPQEVELLERVAQFEGADAVEAWARQFLVSEARRAEAERARSSPPPRQSVINWRAAKRIEGPPEHDAESTPLKRLEALFKQK